MVIQLGEVDIGQLRNGLVENKFIPIRDASGYEGYMLIPMDKVKMVTLENVEVPE